jgi:hypothetical protein
MYLNALTDAFKSVECSTGTTGRAGICKKVWPRAPVKSRRVGLQDFSTMNISQPIPSTVQSVSFSVLTTEDVRRISVKQITNPVLLDDLNRPNLGGLYDPALGPVYKQDM